MRRKRQVYGTGRGCVLERIVEQNVSQPAQQGLIAHNEKIWDVKTCGKLQVANSGYLLPAVDNAAQRLAQIHRLQAESFAPRVCVGQRQQLFDENGGALRLQKNVAQRLPVFRLSPRAPQS